MLDLNWHPLASVSKRTSEGLLGGIQQDGSVREQRVPAVLDHGHVLHRKPALALGASRVLKRNGIALLAKKNPPDYWIIKLGRRELSRIERGDSAAEAN